MKGSTSDLLSDGADDCLSLEGVNRAFDLTHDLVNRAANNVA